ncbi:NAD(P)-binding domain-containing protein [Streptomyces sp. MP131-18]|uniref:NAD(P)-dependent oxidoreductase n=1 Tax=Streptomyces sp. MP131-18 TaxID=1857892 RepID=UPI00097C2452|nr:NAD(P)-binding domain-containing protein [Streptomyces sp. MP131-18]ONK09792.1 2-hydroxy-3-oxopropionate reductase [Streptomyces sp. MP131-18]
MAEDNRIPVTLIGLGSMGAALAEAFVGAGHPTTVWNRTAAKAEPLVAKGAVRAEAIGEAVAASGLVITCMTSYEATKQALEPAADALSGRTLITLNSGIPSHAREFAEWATGHGARFLDGAVKNVPQAVGLADTLIYYSGDKAVFDEYESTVKVLGGDTVFLGPDVDTAKLYEAAVGTTLLPALVGFFQGAAMLKKRGLEVSSMVPYSIKWLEMINSILPVLAEQIDSGDYSQAFSSIGLFHAAIDDEYQMGKDEDVDISWQAPMHDLLRRAVAEGHAEDNISALAEMFLKPEKKD